MKAIYLVCVTCVICSIDARSLSNDIITIDSDVTSEVENTSSDLLAMDFLNELREFRRTKRQVLNANNCAYGYCRKRLGVVVVCVPCRCPKGRC